MPDRVSSGSEDKGSAEYSFVSEEENQATTNPTVALVFSCLKRLEPTSQDELFRPSLQRVGLYIDAFQPIALALNVHAGWSSSWPSKLCSIVLLGPVWDPDVAGVPARSAQIFFWVFCAVVYVTFSALATRTGLDKERMVRIYRVVAHALAAPLYFPILMASTAQMACDPTTNELWLYEGEACDAGLFVAKVLAGLLAVVLHAVLSVTILTAIYEAAPGTGHPQARATSNVDLLIFLFKTLAAVCFHLLLARRMAATFYVLATGMCLAVAGFISFTLPYYSMTTCRIKVTGYLVAAYISFIGFLLAKDPDSTGIADGSADMFALAFGIPAVCVLSSYAAAFRESARCKAAFSSLLVGTMTNSPDVGLFPRYLPDNEQLVSKFNDLEGWLLELEGDESDEHSILFPYIGSVYVATDVEVSTRHLLLWDNVFGVRPSGKMLAMASRIFTKGLAKFADSREVQIQFAAFLIRYLEKSHVAIRFLSSLENMGPTVHVSQQYKIFKMANKMRAGLGIRDRSHSLALDQARKHHKHSLKLMHDFWVRVGSVGQSLKGLAGLANQITESREQAMQSFKWMLAQHSQDTQVLGQFATFLQEVMLDQEAQERCLEEIDAINQAKRNHRSNLSTRSTARDLSFSYLLDGDGQGVVKPATSGGSKTVKLLQITIRVVFLPLLLLIIGNFTMALVYFTQFKGLVHQGYSTGQVRVLSQRIGVTLQQLLDDIEEDEAQGQASSGVDSSSTATNVLVRKLNAINAAFEAHHNRVTFGSAAVTYAPHKKLMKTRSIGIRYHFTADEYTSEVVSVWSVGNLISSVLTLLLQQDLGSLSTHRYTHLLLENLAGPMSHAFNQSASLPAEYGTNVLDTALAAAVILFVVSLIVVFAVYVMFVWNCNKITTSKITTLELFTLIPSGTLQSTAEEARAKLGGFDSQQDLGGGMDDLLQRLDDKTGEGAEEEPPVQLKASCSHEGLPKFMTEQEALESLTDRKASIVAQLLKQGAADTIDFEKEKAAVKTLPKGGKAGDKAAESIKSDTIEATLLECSLAQSSDHEQEIHVEEAHVQADEPTHKATEQRTPSIPWAMALLCTAVFLSAASYYCFELASDQVSEPLQSRQAATETLLLYTGTVESMVRAVRRFTQMGDVRYYKEYWQLVNGGELDEIVQALWSIGLEEDEALLLEEARNYVEKLHASHLISMALMTQYKGIASEAEEMSHVTWAENPVTRSDLMRGRVVLPPAYPQYKHLSFAADSSLPNEDTADLAALLTTQLVASYRIVRFVAGRFALEADPALASAGIPAVPLQELEALITSWTARGHALLLTNSVMTLGRLEASAGLMADALSGDNNQNAVTFVSALSVVIDSYVLQCESAVSALFPSSLVHMSSTDYAATRVLWLNTIAQAWLLERVLRDAMLHVISFDDSSLTVLTTSISNVTTGHSASAVPSGTAEKVNTGITALVTDEVGSLEMFVSRLASLLAGDTVRGYQAACAAEAEQLMAAGILHEVQLFKVNIARLTVFDGYYTSAVEDFAATISSLTSALLNRLTEDGDENLRATRVRITVSAALLLASLFPALFSALLAPPTSDGGPPGDHRAARGAKNFKLAMPFVVLCLSLTGFILLIAISSEVDGVATKYDKVAYIQRELQATMKELSASEVLALGFIQFREERLLMDYNQLRHAGAPSYGESLVHIDTLVSTSSGTLERHMGLLLDARLAVEDIHWLNRIAFRLLYNASSADLIASGRVPALIATQKWNRSREASLMEESLLYPADEANVCMYTTDGADLTLPAADRQQKAAFLLSSQRYVSLSSRVRSNLVNVASSAVSEWNESTDEGQLSTMVFVLQMICLAALSVAIVYLLCSFKEALDSSTEKTDTTGMEDELSEHLTRMTRKVRIALFFIVALVIVIFVTIYSSEKATSEDIRIMNLASAMQWLVARSVIVANKISTDTTISITRLQNQLAQAAVDLRDARENLYFSSSGSQYHFVTTDRTQDELLFGSTDEPSAAAAAEQYQTCSSTGSYRAMTVPIDSLVLNHIVRLESISRSSDRNVGSYSDRADIASTIADLNTGVDALLEGLHASVIQFRTSCEDKAAQGMVQCTLACVITIVLIFFVYQFAFLPLISKLVSEEDGTKLMLNMIPHEVRESVPEIAEHFTTGEVDEEEKMKKQLQQSEKLLQNILPPVISRRLKAGEALIADDHPKVTVAFCALVGFDEFSKEMSAKQIVSFLNDLFTRFDEITDKLDIEKIKTIGHIYFMCGGLSESTREDHPLRVVDTVLKFFETLTEHNNRHNSQQLLMKAGINTGPAVAGVIGSKKVAYDLWGDAVNVASRLCGTGQNGKIAVYGSVYEEVNEYFSFHERQVEAKGKGRITTYILESRIKPTPYGSYL